MKSLKLISFTTFFLLLVITSSLAGDEDDDKKDKQDKKKDDKVELVKERVPKSQMESAKDTGGAVLDKLDDVPTKDKAMIGVVVGGIFVVIILLVCLFYPKCPMYPLSGPCRDACCPDGNPFNRESAVKREVKDGQIETTKGQWVTPVEDA